MTARILLVVQRPMIYRCIIGWPIRRQQTIFPTTQAHRPLHRCVDHRRTDKRPIYGLCFATEFSTTTSAHPSWGETRGPRNIRLICCCLGKNRRRVRSLSALLIDRLSFSSPLPIRLVRFAFTGMRGNRASR